MPENQSRAVRFVDRRNVAVSLADLPEDQRTVLYEINQQIAARQSLEEVIDFLFDSTRSISPCDRIGLALLTDDGHRIAAHYARAAYEPLRLVKGYTEDLQAGSLDTVLESRRLRIISDLEAYLTERPESNSTRLLVAEGVRSSMTCPLLVDDRVVGVLFRSSRQPNAYDDRQALLHQVIAERLSQAVEKTLQIEQLAAAQRDYFGTLAFVTHELKSPISGMLTEASLLRDGLLGDLTPQQRERIERMMGRGRYLLNLIEEYLNLARIEGGKLEPDFQQADLTADVIEPAIDLIQAQIEEREMTLERDFPDGPIQVELDPNLFKIVVVNLLGNGAKYGRQGGRLRLRVTSEPDRLTLTVYNEGPGFPPGERGKLFRKFSRVQSAELLKRKGTGIGLYTCWRIVRAHGGRITAESREGEFAEFTVQVPQPPQPMAGPDLSGA